MQANLAQEGLDVNNVLQWNGRPKRERKPAPTTYWEEFVETDTWYQRELVRDIPPEEMYAACEDTDLDGDEGEEGEEEESDEGEESEEGEEEENDDSVDEDDEFLDDAVEEDEEDSASDDMSYDASDGSDSGYRTPPRRTQEASIQRTT